MIYKTCKWVNVGDSLVVNNLDSDELKTKPKVGFKFDELCYEDSTESKYKVIDGEKIDLTGKEITKIYSFLDKYKYPDRIAYGVDKVGNWLGQTKKSLVAKETTPPPEPVGYLFDFDLDDWKECKTIELYKDQLMEAIDNISLRKFRVDTEKEILYKEKYDQAVWFIDNKCKGITKCPMVKVDSDLYGSTHKESAENIVTKYERYLKIKADKEKLRLSYKAAIREVKERSEADKLLEKFKKEFEKII